MLQRMHPDVACVCLCVFVWFPSKLPQTQMEWAQLLEAQQRYHDAELQKWREIIKSSVVLLDQVRQLPEAFVVAAWVNSACVTLYY